MAHGFQLINTNGNYLVNTVDTNELLYQQRQGSEGEGTITGATDSAYNVKEVTFSGSLENSIVFIRPSDRTERRRLIVDYTDTKIRVWKDGGTDVEFKVFDRVTDITQSALETGFGFNTYKADGTTIHWSSNALNARVKSILTGSGEQVELDGAWVNCLAQPTRTTYVRSGPPVDAQMNVTTVGYLPEWNSDGTFELAFTTMFTWTYDSKGYAETTVYELGSTVPKALVADLGDVT